MGAAVKVQPLRAYIQRMEPDGETAAGARIKVMFNPGDLSITKGVQLGEVPVPGLAVPLQQFVRGQAAKLTVKLFFDSTDDGMGPLAKGVTEKTDAFVNLVMVHAPTHAPPVVRFVWGRKFPGSQLPEDPSQRQDHFVGVIESIQQDYSLFSPKGVPLRATLTMVLREYRSLATQVRQLRLASPDRTHRHIVLRGERLSGIAASVLGRTSDWRAIAAHNGIDDPRRVPAGTILAIPPVDAGGVAVVAVAAGVDA